MPGYHGCTGLFSGACIDTALDRLQVARAEED